MQADPIPALRTDLELTHRADGYVDVRDPKLFNVYVLDESYLTIAGQFDGDRGVSEVQDALLELTGEPIDADEVVDAVDCLTTLLLLDTPEVANAEPEVDNAPPPALLDGVDRELSRLPIVEPIGKWSCHSCGSCCHGLAVELTEAEEARIDGSLYRDVLGDLSFAVEAFIDPAEPAKRILRQRSEEGRACIFLDAEGLCLIHARQGMDKKPDACQIFPYLIVHVPGQAPRLGMRTNCHTMYESWKTGAPPEEAVPEVRRLLKTHSSLAAPKVAEWLEEELPIAAVVEKIDTLGRLLEETGVTPAGLRSADRALFGGRALERRRAYGKKLLEYLDDEENGPVPVEEGSLGSHLSLVRRPKAVLEAMMTGRRPAAPRPDVAAFLARQTRIALHGLGTLNFPDAGYGTIALLLGLEASLHAVGPRGRLRTANRAFMAFSAPILEATAHAWPVLDAIDPRYGAELRETYAALFA